MHEEDKTLPSSVRLLGGLFSLLLLAVAMVGDVAAIAAQGGRWNHRLDLLTHFAPIWLIGGIVSLVAALLLSRGWLRNVTSAFSLLALFSAVALMWVDLSRLPDAFRQDPPDPSAQSLKIIEFNAWNWHADPGRVAQWIAAEQPDVVVIEEPSPALEQDLVELAGLQLHHGSGASIGTRDAPLGKHVAWEVRQLPGEPTEFAWVDLKAPDGTPFTVIGVHCKWPIPARMAWGQDQNIAALLGTLNRSNVILTGDFNSTQWSFRQRVADAAFGIERRDLAMPTWPARLPMLHGVNFPFPFLSIDHVYAGSSWKTVSVKRGPRLGSDHYPTVIRLQWAPA